ncbi:tail fiber protein [Oxalobacter aliiformigenes]|uniref:tail fiber protein n=1 Tax=Oxalobacter aliiformigenes TaxID=2946593 RepID=UPI0022AE92CA|nr:tail fiber protein [Oxalobacter aliiformigenes]MCZ4064118.1 tail fiber protein [Oxalobacter aliiformigenes]WAV99494.1 tail fiber protein [Oxalobacter aliiformigenes]
MTVDAITRKAGPYQYTAGASYPFYYKVFSAEDVAVYVVQDSSEVQLTEDQYTVNLNDDQDNNPGGTVSVSVTCESITIVSDVDYTQETVITNRGGFYPDVLNKIHDKLTILIQQILTTLNRTVKIKVTDATSDPDKILDNLKTTASAAAESAAISVSAAQASADSAATAIATANTAVSKSETAITTADTANATATQALSSIPSTVAETVNTTISGMDIPQLVSDDVDNKIDSLNLDEKIASEVKDAIAGTEIPGLTPETIAGALGYVPYDAETNSQDFATSAEVAEAISEIPNADWNATEGAAEIKNKPGDFGGATAETAGKQGFVPAPEAGDQDKVLTGSGEWKHASGVPVGTVVMFTAAEPPAGYLKCDGSAVGRETYPELYAAIGTTYGEGDGETTFNLPDSGYKRIDFDAGTTELTAPDNGYIFVKASASLGGFYLRNLTKDYLSESLAERDWGLGAFIPCFKGDQIEISSWQSTINSVFFATSPSAPFCESSNGCLCIKAFDAAVDTGLIDITELANEVAEKADTSLSNLNTTGKAKVANLAMPSSVFVDLTLPATGGGIIAPADGYFYLTKRTTAAAQFIELNGSVGAHVTGSYIDEWLRCFIPVRMGQKCSVFYSAAGNTELFRFYYAEGSQP